MREYIDFVDEGNIQVGTLIQLAMERHLRDVEKSKDPDYPYEYRPELTHAPIMFIDNLRDPKSGKRMGLARFQKFIIAMIYGWVHKETGFRRFRKIVISMARKNGKSLIVAGIALYELLYERDPYSSRQVYSIANTREQAGIVFKMIRSQLRSVIAESSTISKFAKVRTHDIVTVDDSVCKALASDATTLDGLDVCTAIFDECAEYKDDSVIEVIESSQAQQHQPLNLLISTVSANLNGNFHLQEFPMAKAVLTGETESETYLPLIWQLDTLEEWEDDNNWEKCNPLFELPEVKRGMMTHKKSQLDAGRIKGNLTNFFTKELNWWCAEESTTYVQPTEWENCEVSQTPDLRGRQVYIGVDLARVNDLCSLTWVVPIEEEERFWVDSKSWVATGGDITRKEDADKTPYRAYERNGYCSISSRGDGQADWDDMLQWLLQWIDENELMVEAICYDPAQSQLLTKKLADEGYEDFLVPVRQSYMQLNPPTKQLQTDIRAGKLSHGNNPLLTRAMYNAYTKEKDDLIMIDKAMNRNKIDPLDALICAYSQAYFHEFTPVNLSEMYKTGKFGFGL